MTVAYESLGQIDKLTVSPVTKRQQIMTLSMRNLFQIFAYRMRPEVCSQLNKTYEFQFPGH